MEVIKFTWAQVQIEFVHTDLMESGLNNLGFSDLNNLTFIQNGRWLIVDGKFAWDDTTGEWSPIGDIDLDD